MHADYYQSILYPLQDKVLEAFSEVNTSFYLTGGTALSRAYLHHRFSDDLDFFVNDDASFKQQTETIIQHFKERGFTVEIVSAHSSFTRVFIVEQDCTLKIDFINDVRSRFGDITRTELCIRTDSIRNIVSNKLTALGRLEAKDVVDLIYIAKNYAFNWQEIIQEAQEKDLWVNPVEIASLLEQFPLEKRNEIAWTSNTPDVSSFKSELRTMISDILTGKPNSLNN